MSDEKIISEEYIMKLQHSIHSMEHNLDRLNAMVKSAPDDDIPEYIINNWKEEIAEIELLKKNTENELAALLHN